MAEASRRVGTRKQGCLQGCAFVSSLQALKPAYKAFKVKFSLFKGLAIVQFYSSGSCISLSELP